jgi:RimJ/RimL family protein N-acetyltransferase
MTEPAPGFETERLRGRPWRESDRAPFARLNADLQVMAFFATPLLREASDALVDRANAGIAERGWGLFAVETRAGGDFIGFVGLSPVPATLPFAPGVEVGWRLARAHWGHGYATEAARACLDLAFGPLGLDEVVSFTAIGNLRSRAVMERLGMTLALERFEHTSLPEGHPIRPHCLYRITRAQHPAGAAA